MNMGNIKIGKKLGIGFSIVIAFIVGMTAFTQDRMSTLAELTTDLYDDSYKIGTAILKVEVSMEKTLNHMRVLVQLEEPKEIRAEGEIISDLDKMIKSELGSVVEHYPGSKADIENVNKELDQWKETRWKAIDLMLNDKWMDGARIIGTLVSTQYSTALKSVEKIRETSDASATAALSQANETRDNTLFLNILLAGIIVVVSVLISLFITKSLTTPIGRAVKIAQEISQGNFKSNIKVTSKDEVGDLLQALHRMKTDLFAKITEEKEQALRIKTALDQVSANVMIADAEYNIFYTNDSAENLLTELDSEFKKAVSSFDVTKLSGSNMDMFHKDPEKQRKLLNGLTGTYKSKDLQVGEATIRIVANPVVNNKGERIATVVEWVNRTEEANAEREVQGIVEEALEGNLSARLATDGKDGFFKMLSVGINSMVEVNEQVISDVGRIMGAVSRGDLTEKIAADYMGAYEQLKTSSNATVDKLRDVVSEIRQSSSAVKTGTDEIAKGNLNLSQRTEEQASSLQETASGMEEMTGTVQQNADNAKQANQLAKSARDQAEQGNSVVSNAIVAMGEINSASKKIADIIGVIDEIAFQTNLLALNAAVEAARAGEQGRGFAVVASEVRNLAQRSAGAAKEIKELINDSVEKVDEGSRMVNDSGETLSGIVESVKKVSDIIAEIAAASNEQSTGIDEISRAIMHMDEMTQQNAALVEEAASSSESMSDKANGLAQLVSFFNDGSESSDEMIVDRRTAARPWAENEDVVKQADNQRKEGAPALKTGTSNADEWEDF